MARCTESEAGHCGLLEAKGRMSFKEGGYATRSRDSRPRRMRPEM